MSRGYHSLANLPSKELQSDICQNQIRCNLPSTVNSGISSGKVKLQQWLHEHCSFAEQFTELQSDSIVFFNIKCSTCIDVYCTSMLWMTLWSGDPPCTMWKSSHWSGSSPHMPCVTLVCDTVHIICHTNPHAWQGNCQTSFGCVSEVGVSGKSGFMTSSCILARSKSRFRAKTVSRNNTELRTYKPGKRMYSAVLKP